MTKTIFKIQAPSNKFNPIKVYTPMVTYTLENLGFKEHVTVTVARATVVIILKWHYEQCTSCKI